MLRLICKWAWLLFLLPVSASAQDQGLWAYGCDHFLYGACFRIPNDISVTHTVPVDFGLHTFMREGHGVLTVYEGDAPGGAPSALAQSLELKGNGYHLRGYIQHQGQSSRYVVIVDSARAGDMTLNLSGETNSLNDKNILAAILGGFRVCRFKQTRNDQVLACPRSSDWGQRLASWVIGAREDGVGAGMPQVSEVR